MGINFQKVSFKYAPLLDDTLKDISLNINEKDEFIFILGHTGSGKSTLVQNMNALLLPYSGCAEVFDKKIITRIYHPLRFNTKKNQKRYNMKYKKGILNKGNMPVYSKNLRAIREHIGLVFQFPEYQLFESTVLKDVMFGPKNFGHNKEEALIAAKKALKLVEFPESLYDRNPFLLSGGQMRRVAIAGILAIDPDVIILDEPTVGLDPKGKETLMKLLVNIQKETHKSIIIISHDMNVVAEYAKRIIVMSNGEIVYDGNKRPLFEDLDLLYKYNLDLAECSKIAIELKKRNLISYKHLPLDKNELKTVILGGDIYE